MRAMLGDQHVLRQRFQLAVMLELPTPVIGFGRIRQHFDDEGRIQQRIPLAIVELGLAADHDYIRVGEQSGWTDLDPHGAGVGLTGTFFQLPAKFGNSVDDDEAMRLVDPGHGNHFTVEIFALPFSAALKRKIVFRTQI